MPPCHPFRPVPGQCGPNRRGPLPAPPFDPRDYWATRKCVSRLFASLGTKLDKVDVVDPGAAAEAGKAADAKSTYEELNKVLTKLAEKADKATTLAGYGITDAATKTEIAAKADLVDGKVPAAQLPSYVDDVLEYDTMSAFPATGESGKIYVAKDANKTYRWSGTQYVEISPSPVLDDTVTEESPNGVKSSGIWSWVKSLLPHWLTSDYTEPATVASVANKRDKDDLAVYKLVKSAFVLHKDGLTDITLPFIVKDQGKPYPYNEYDWVCPIGETTSFHAIVFSDGQWKLNVDDGMEYGYSSASEDALRIEFDNGYVATRSSIISAVPVDDQQLAAVATDNALKPSDGDLVKYDAANDRLVKATASDIPELPYLSTKSGGTVDGFVVFNRLVVCNSEIQPATVRAMAGDVIATVDGNIHNLSHKADRATTLAGYGITDGATKESLAPEYSATSAYSVGAIVWHDGNIYQCKAAIAEGGEAWNAEHWELKKLNDFFTESNSLLTDLIAIKTSGKADRSDLDALTAKVDTANAALEEVA